MIRKYSVLTLLLALAGSLAATGAQARDLFWSVGIQAPLHYGGTIGTVVSNAPAYRPAPIYHLPAPVYYDTTPVYRPAPVVYLPQPVYRARRIVYAAPVWAARGHGPRHWRHTEHPPIMASYGR